MRFEDIAKLDESTRSVYVLYYTVDTFKLLGILVICAFLLYHLTKLVLNFLVQRSRIGSQQDQL